MKEADSRFANHTVWLLTMNTQPREWWVHSYSHEQPAFKMVIPTAPTAPKEVLHCGHSNVRPILCSVKVKVLRALTFWEAASSINGQSGGIQGSCWY